MLKAFILVDVDLVILVFVLPLWLIGGLRLSQRREKAGLMFVFLLGAITILVSTSRFIAMMMLSNNIMICMPSIPPFLFFSKSPAA